MASLYRLWREQRWKAIDCFICHCIKRRRFLGAMDLLSGLMMMAVMTVRKNGFSCRQSPTIFMTFSETSALKDVLISVLVWESTVMHCRVGGEILELLLEGLGGIWGKDERAHFLAEVESNDSSLLCITNHKGFCHLEDQDRIRHCLPFILCLQYQSNDSFTPQLFLHNKWLQVSPQPHSLFVIVGVILNVWSNGEYKSVVVRPMAGAEEERCTVIAVIRSPCREMSIRPLMEALDCDNKKKKPVYSSSDLKEYASRVLRHRFVFEDHLQRYRIDSPQL